ncbi:nucleotide exchange factor GrpE [Dysgonomonas sp. 216]|uniref:nucleotide exchange factor GrpE n=1 Tax=Dysgonomonas sp. 216 TaxID=2302934 RepID=UPI0013D5B0BE|nr:nucleotide exchange factor GrpE [Dysgonomonas sp. 216]NDW18007.1 nucleotide exchange factor GrpE [Dysgonomonas sp. 216]
MEEKKNEEAFVPEEETKDNNLTNEQTETKAEDSASDNLSESDEVNWKEKYDELNDSYLRLYAEFDNFRRRTLKEKSELMKTASEKVMVDILPVVDDFERALENIAKSTDVDSAKQGVELIYDKFVNFLLKNGVKKMDVLGEVFDTEKHEALTTIPAQNDDMKDKIIDCIQSGYELGDKVIRFPKVVVAK